MKLQFRNAAIAAALVFASCSSALAETTATKREIAHLLDYVATPGCEFNRNGTWHKGAKAREHLKEKFEYMQRRRMITNAESFIEGAASTSSMTGKPYMVRCGNSAATPSGLWLSKELKRFRASGPPTLQAQ